MPNKRILNSVALSLVIAAVTYAQQPDSSPGTTAYQTRCVLCHGCDGSGSDRAPAILDYISANSPAQLAALIRNGVPDKGMPPFEIPEDQLAHLVSYLQTFRGAPQPGGQTARPPSQAQRQRPRQGQSRRSAGGPPIRSGSVKLSDGRALEGLILNESGFDTQLRTADGKIHRLVREGDAYREAPLEPKMDWPSYHGSFHANRHSPLDQINTSNVARLAPRWFFPIAGVRMIEGTPLVVDGIIYITVVNQVYALDAVTGREIWRHIRPRSEGLMGDAAIGLNRGVGIAGDRLFTLTDNAHIIALDRFSGELLWDTEMADSREHYGGIAAPLVVGDLVIAGISGGDTGLRGFLDAYYVSTGERAWRAGLGNLGQRAENSRKRLRRYLAHRQLRPRSRLTLLAHGESLSRHER